MLQRKLIGAVKIVIVGEGEELWSQRRPSGGVAVQLSGGWIGCRQEGQENGGSIPGRGSSNCGDTRASKSLTHLSRWEAVRDKKLLPGRKEPHTGEGTFFSRSIDSKMVAPGKIDNITDPLSFLWYKRWSGHVLRVVLWGGVAEGEVGGGGEGCGATLTLGVLSPQAWRPSWVPWFSPWRSCQMWWSWQCSAWVSLPWSDCSSSWETCETSVWCGPSTSTRAILKTAPRALIGKSTSTIKVGSPFSARVGRKSVSSANDGATPGLYKSAWPKRKAKTDGRSFVNFLPFLEVRLSSEACKYQPSHPFSLFSPFKRISETLYFIHIYP